AGGVAARMAPAEAWLIALGLWVGAGLAAARFLMTRNLRWAVAAGGCLVGLAVLGGVWWDDARKHDPRPVVVVSADTPLRAGNGDSYPARLDRPLPRGVEARELARRGGWVQVELAGGAVGWLPDRSVLPAE
ncbi:MAG: hypothetical protein K2X82_25005, partial [Gemmataceae bacterium]|nr:hypothetical protein [Gemmataceae bacterium]